MTQQPTGFGLELANLRLNLVQGSAWSDTARRTPPGTAPNTRPWTSAPTIEFGPDVDAPTATWTAVIDPANGDIAAFTEERTTVAARIDGEAWRLRDNATDEILAKGRVVLQATT